MPMPSQSKIGTVKDDKNIVQQHALSNTGMLPFIRHPPHRLGIIPEPTFHIA
ncbi:hypothetical protein SCARR_03187 [Pontiella sulfatireligans]|uniref:Uncharacterized protein n=1 Tax=Pontiella sulfatireligans TaxID=2750658 RepID=A0A6C2UP79_9BACT|nr:hypothetical protein SCARR_03187 [Pontiella sulfatireligans]